jgi:hypothetical protein
MLCLLFFRIFREAGRNFPAKTRKNRCRIEGNRAFMKNEKNGVMLDSNEFVSAWRD